MIDAMKILAQASDGDVTKFVSGLADGACIESVLIPTRNRTTLCVSCQVGCRMGCAFCVTGQMGFVRNLAAEEIVGQVTAASARSGRSVDNVVFMGMGEPLDNLDAVMQAIGILSDQRGMDIALRHITLSTAGHADGIRALAALPSPRPRLALSLHTADSDLRDRLVPLNRKYPLSRLREELLAFPFGKRGVVFIEYVVLAGLNHSYQDARRLAAFLEGVPARINLIAYNSDGHSSFRTPTAVQVNAFRHWLAAAGLFVRIRPSRGVTILAACGQLGTMVSAVSSRIPGAHLS
jgi:23S rRNA (adenine2503-C2)-methyltransferase